MFYYKGGSRGYILQKCCYKKKKKGRLWKCSRLKEAKQTGQYRSNSRQGTKLEGRNAVKDTQQQQTTPEQRQKVLISAKLQRR